MRLLLDTHVVLWWLADDSTLSDETKELLDRETECYVSSATLWEVTIKQARGKLLEPPDLAERIRDAEFQRLPIEYEHAITAGHLPTFHHDPFDRVLIAQAQREGLTLITRDAQIQKYDVETLEA